MNKWYNRPQPALPVFPSFLQRTLTSPAKGTSPPSLSPHTVEESESRASCCLLLREL